MEPTQDNQPVSEKPASPERIPDDAFSWLESLAAKQGAKPEELLTNPGERSEKIPDWLSQAGEKPAGEQVPPDEQAAHINEAFPVKADMGITPEHAQKVSENVGTEPPEGIPATSTHVPSEEDMTITTWLSKQDVKEALEKKAAEKHAEVEPTTTGSELPDWLKDLEKPAPSVEAPKADNELPEWLRYANPSSTTGQVPTSSKVEPSPEAESPSWLDENVPSPERAAPTLPEEWLPAQAGTESGHVDTRQDEHGLVPEKASQVNPQKNRLMVQFLLSRLKR